MRANRHTSRYRLQKHGLIMLFVNITSTFLGIMSGLLIAATLGPFSRGVYQAWRILGAICSDIANFGLGKFIASKFNIESNSFKEIFHHIPIVFVFYTALIPLMLNLNFSIYLISLFYLLIPIGILTDLYLGLLTRSDKFKIISLWDLLVWAGGSIETRLL